MAEIFPTQHLALFIAGKQSFCAISFSIYNSITNTESYEENKFTV